MNNRSLKVSLDYLQKVKRQLERKGMTQKQLADFVECSSQPVSKFFTGKPVDRTLFIIICQQLDLDYQEVIDITNRKNDISDEIIQKFNLDINALVKDRCKIKTQSKHSILSL